MLQFLLDIEGKTDFQWTNNIVYIETQSSCNIKYMEVVGAISVHGIMSY